MLYSCTHTATVGVKGLADFDGFFTARRCAQRYRQNSFTACYQHQSGVLKTKLCSEIRRQRGL